MAGADKSAAANRGRKTRLCILASMTLGKGNDRALYDPKVHNRSLSVKRKTWPSREATMKKGEATRSRIIEEATRLAAVRGLSTVSLADIAEPVRLSKSGLFKHFESKEAMQQAVLASAFDQFAGFVWTPCADLPKGRRRLEAVFERWIDWVVHENQTGGCPINAMIMEFDDQPGPLRDYLRKRLIAWRLNLVRDFMAMRDPPLREDEAWQAMFETKAFILGYSEMARLMEDRQARPWARRAFAALLDRLASKG